MKKFIQTTLLYSTLLSFNYQITPATTPQHNLDIVIHKCFEKYAPEFSNITLTNIPIQAIENLKVDLLFYLKRAEKKQSNHFKIESALNQLNTHNPIEAINKFKIILKLLAPDTKALISNTITNPLIRGFLQL